MRQGVRGGRGALAAEVALLCFVLGCGRAPVADPDGGVPGAVPGPWAIPSDVESVGDTLHVEATQGGPWEDGAGCAGDLRPGAVALGVFLVGHFPQIERIEGYACRPNSAAPTRLSVHGTGRALDVFVPTVGGDANNLQGDPVANWLVEHAAEIGIQYLVWDSRCWDGSADPGRKTRLYTGPNPHVDHLHVELSVDGAERRTAWFRGT